nr:MRE11 [Batillipes sp.]
MNSSKPNFTTNTNPSNIAKKTPSASSRIQNTFLKNSQVITAFDSDNTNESDFRCLVATDIHLGFKDHEPLIKDDSFRTFEEVLKTAKEKNVDCVLLAGNLFHHFRPSRLTVTKTTDLLHKYCLGENPVGINFLSNPKELFSHANPAYQKPNWEDPNINICLPIFSIHGNHDNPVSSESLSEMDVLHQQRLINYFGKFEDKSKILLHPIVLEKEGTVLALYGLGSIMDERLNFLMRNGKIKFVRPTPFKTADGKVTTPPNIYNILLFHQNRIPRGSKNYIPEDMIPDWINLIVWGHEHESIPHVINYGKRKILQPGSTIATSFSKDETCQKHVFVLHINGLKNILEPVPLKSVRPLYLHDINLQNTKFNKTNINKEIQIELYVNCVVENLINSAINEAKYIPGKPREPLIRLRVKYNEDEKPLNQKKFGKKFLGRVACPDEILLNVRKQKIDESQLKRNQKPEKKLNTTSMEDFIAEKLKEQNATLKIQDLGMFLEALKLRVDKDDKTAILDVLNYQNFNAKQEVLKNNPSIENMNGEFDSYVKNRTFCYKEEISKFHNWRSEMLQHAQNVTDSKRKEAPVASLSADTEIDEISICGEKKSRITTRRGRAMKENKYVRVVVRGRASSARGRSGPAKTFVRRGNSAVGGRRGRGNTSRSSHFESDSSDDIIEL